MIKNFKQFLFIAALLIIAAGAQPSIAAFYQWSTTAATNATADPSINWAEGMSPSSVNDSARAMMSVLAGWRNDTSGRLTTTGSSAAYVLATSQSFPSAALADGAMVAFTAHVTSGAAPTFAVDSVPAAPFIIDGLGVSGTPAPGSSMVAGAVYSAVYTLSSNTWRLREFYGSSFNIPLGGILWSTAPTAPNSNFVAPSGQCISTTTYASYWVQQGSPASGGCPGGQFAIIDMRGRVAAALDTLNASAANRLTNSANGCGVAFTAVGAVCTENQSTTLVTLNLPAYTPAGSVSVTSTRSDITFSPGTTDNYGSIGGACCFTSQTRGSVTSTGSLTGTAQGGTSTPFSKVQPTIGLIPYLRVL